MQNTIPINKNIPPTDNKMFIKLEERLFPVPEKDKHYHALFSLESFSLSNSK